MTSSTSTRPRILVCGGRDYDDAEHVERVLDEEDPIFVVQGGARGADTLARRWAEQRGVACATMHAWWNTYGNSAGGRRNGWMLMFTPVDKVIAFPGGRGTNDMVMRAARAGIIIRNEREYRWNEPKERA